MQDLRVGISAASSWAWGAVVREVINLYVQFGVFWNQKNWRDVYQILIAGDPKKRSLRALRTQSVLNRNEKNAAR
jgi:hypothetical protein